MPLKSRLLSIASLALILAAPRPGHAQSPDESRVPAGEPELWQRIVALEPLPTATQLSENWFEAARERRRGLLARVRLYLTLYPGGAHRYEAVRLELTALFELGTLPGGTLAPLRERVEEILRAPPSEASRDEAAYWAIVCQRWQASAAATQPVGQGRPGGPAAAQLRPDADTLHAYREYVEKYPRSQYAPRLAARLFADAARRGDRADMQRIVQRMTECCPQQAGTAQLAAEWRREALVGEPFWPASPSMAGCPWDSRDYAGAPLLIVVWAAFDEPSCRCVPEIERFRKDHPALRVIGISLDESAEPTVAAARELGVDWLQCNDRLGWGGAFVRFWGIDRIPYVLAIDQAGRLAGSAPVDGWETLARRVLTEGAN